MLTAILSILMTLFIGGVITGNILGDMRNKAAGIVFYSWKGIQVFRKYVDQILNPRSSAQTTQRNNFKRFLSFGQDLLLTHIQPYWKAYAIKMSEINAFMSYNLKNLSGPSDFSNVLVVRSPIELPAVTISDASAEGNTVSLSIDALGAFNGSTNFDFIQMIVLSINGKGAAVSNNVVFSTSNPLAFTVEFPAEMGIPDDQLALFLFAFAEDPEVNTDWSQSKYVTTLDIVAGA